MFPLPWRWAACLFTPGRQKVWFLARLLGGAAVLWLCGGPDGRPQALPLSLLLLKSSVWKLGGADPLGSPQPADQSGSSCGPPLASSVCFHRLLSAFTSFLSGLTHRFLRPSVVLPE